MLQRIQTVYLFLVFLFSILFLLLPSGIAEIGGIRYTIKLWDMGPLDEHVQYPVLLKYLLLVLPFIIMGLTLFTAFQFKKRLYQIRLGKINIFIHLVLVVSVIFFLDNFRELPQLDFTYGAAIVFPLLSMILIMLANRAIKKDEELVRSADRLR